MTTRGLWKATGYWNTVEARKDWQRLANEAAQNGYAELVDKCAPPEDAGWRKIDKCIARLRKELEIEWMKNSLA